MPGGVRINFPPKRNGFTRASPSYPIITSLRPITCYLQEVFKEVWAFEPAIFSPKVRLVRHSALKIVLSVCSIFMIFLNDLREYKTSRSFRRRKKRRGLKNGIVPAASAYSPLSWLLVIPLLISG